VVNATRQYAFATPGFAETLLSRRPNRTRWDWDPGHRVNRRYCPSWLEISVLWTGWEWRRAFLRGDRRRRPWEGTFIRIGLWVRKHWLLTLLASGFWTFAYFVWE